MLKQKTKLKGNNLIVDRINYIANLGLNLADSIIKIK